MIRPPADLQSELQDALEAFGLIAPDGSFDASWFVDPMGRVARTLSDANQRAAIERVLAGLFPPEVPGATTRRHPVVTGAAGTIFVTVEGAAADPSVWGASARWAGGTPGLPDVSLTVDAPLVSLSASGAQPVLASASHPLSVALRVAIPGGAIGGVTIAAVRAGLVIAGDSRGLAVTLERLDLGDGRGPHDVTIDPSAVSASAEANAIIVALLRGAIAECDAAAGPARDAITGHLAPLLGLDPTSAIPRLPIDELATGPAPLRTWMRALAAGPAAAWLAHLAGLLRGETVAASGDGSADRPWRVELAALSPTSALALTIATTTNALELGVVVDLVPAGASPAAAVSASATVLSIPFAATDDVSAVGRWDVSLRAPSNDGEWLAGTETAAFGVRSLRAGFRGAPSPSPRLELLQVRIDGTEHARLDLSTPGALADSAKTIVRDALRAAVGSSPTATRVLALAGVVPPESDPAWPHELDLGAFVADPIRAIASVHRRALLDPAHPWSALFAEIVALAGLSGPVEGSGTAEDPWRAGLAAAGPVGVDLIAWDAGSGMLRFGIRAGGAYDPMSAAWRCELLAADLPADGLPDVRLGGAQELRVAISPVPIPHSLPGIALGADSFSAFLGWAPGQGVRGGATIASLAVTVGTETISIPALTVPPAVAPDPAHPEVAFGIAAPALDALARSLLTRASISWGGYSGFVVASLLGLHDSLAARPDGWPTLRPAGGATSVVSDPPAALQDFLRRLATGDPGKKPPLPVALAWLAGILGKSLPARLVDPMASEVAGRGAPADPWLLPIADTSASIAAWLAPAGPAGSWASALSNHLTNVESIPDLLEVARGLARIDAQTADALAGADLDPLGFAIAKLSNDLATGDGLVPYRCQLAFEGAWERGARVKAAHADVPKDADAIAQVLDRIDHVSSGARTVLLVSPSFGDAADWGALLASATSRGHAVDASAKVDLRVDGSLDALAAVADYYVVVLGETSATSTAAEQLARAIDKVRTLRGGAAVVLVGHSTAGLGAREVTAADPSKVRALVTLATPLGGSPLLPLRDAQVADAHRRLAAIGPIGVAGGPLARALAQLGTALDGWEIDDPALPPRASRFPWADFAGGGSLETGGVSALAIGSAIDEDLVGTFKAALAARIADLSASADAAPAHLAFGLRAPIVLGDLHPGEVRVEADVTGELFRVLLTGDRPRAELGTRIAARIRLSRDGDWLAGSAGARSDPASDAPETRVREATFQVAFTPEDGTSVDVRLLDASHRGVSRRVAGLDDSIADPLLGAVAGELAGSRAGAAAAALADGFVALGLGVRSDDGSFAFSTDALIALRLAPGGFLSARLATALAAPGGWLGFAGPSSGPWVRSLAGSPATIGRAHDGTWTVALQTGAATPIPLADTASIGVDATWGASAPVVMALAAAVGRANVSWSSTRGTLALDTDGLSDPLTLWPAPSPSARAEWIAHALPRFVLSAAASAVVESIFGAGVRIGPLHGLLESPSRTLTRPGALGRSSGGGVDAGRVRGLFDAIAGFLGQPAGAGIPIPGGLRLAVGAGDDVRVTVSTDAAIGGTLGLALELDVDDSLDIALGGTLGLDLDFGAAPWGGASIEVGRAAGTLSLVVTPRSGSPIRLLPTFGGFGSLVANLEALVPKVLDSLAGALPASPLRTLALEVAAAVGIWDATGGFAAHADAIRDLGTPGALDRVALGARAPVATALLRLLQDPSSPLAGALPGSFALDGDLVRWTLPALPGGAGTLGAAAGWDADGPRVEVSLMGVRRAGAGAIDLAFSYAAATPSLTAAFDLDLLPALAVSVAPRLELTAAPLRLAFLPLGAGTASALAIELLPAPALVLGDGGAAGIAEIAASFAGTALIRRAGADLDGALWSGGPTARALLEGAHLITTDTGRTVVARSFPDALDAIGGLLATLASGTAVAIGDASLGFSDEGGVLGIRLTGSLATNAGGFRVKALFGPRDVALADPDAGVTLELLRRDAAGDVSLAAGLRAVGLGVELGRPGDDALVSSGSFRLGRAAGYVFFDLPLAGGATPAEPFGAALALDQVSVPLGNADASGDNPVAASLLHGTGDASAAPGVDVIVARRRGVTTFLVGGTTQPLWIDVERAFGPLEIDRLGVRPLDGPGVALAIDGGVKVDGFTAQVDDLSVSFALADVLRPERWTLDLAGLALAYTGKGVSIAGGLTRDAGPPVEYDGMLLVKAGGRTITAIGAYARAGDAAGAYTSLFAFVALPWTLGGPPFFFVTGVAAGLGYNRALVVPAAVEDVVSHPLLRALDDNALAADPAAALHAMRSLVPARRGGFWVAAGVRFTSFALVHSMALVYVALDGGVEVGVLGVSRLLYPTADEAIASVELALKARFSSAERLLSVQAQLTDHSWIFSKSCKLTGGFAFFTWFDTGETVFTLGGYNPHFAKPAKYPDVPRLGFSWKPTDEATASGEAYFAITTSCVMAGGKLSIVYQSGSLYASFTAGANILVSWDPFHYDFDISVEVAGSYTYEICPPIVDCFDFTLDFSIGASLRLYGPPLAGEVTVDLDVVSVTIPFGAAGAQPTYMAWDAFAEKYLFAGDDAREGVRALLATGAERTAGSAAPPSGAAGSPWIVSAESSFAVETRMAATTLQGAAPAGVDALDIAPMNAHAIASDLTVVVERQDGTLWTPLLPDGARISIAAVQGPVPEATWRLHDEVAAAANNLMAVVGATLTLAAVGRDPSAIVAVATLATDDPRWTKPLPFARVRPADVDAWHTAGLAAEALAAVGSGSDPSKAASVADAVLASDARFASNRASSGLPSEGLSPGSRRALRRARSSPPAVAPLSQGMTMRAPGLAPVAPPRVLVAAAPLALTGPRLRAVLRPAAAAVPAASATRSLASTATTKPSNSARAANEGLVITSIETGAGAGAAHARAIAQAEAAIARGGVSIAGGTTQVWDLPRGTHRLRLTGTSAMRVTSLGRNGVVLADAEAASGSTTELPRGTERVALTALGVGAVTHEVAGWTSTQSAVRVGAATALVGGAHLVLPRGAPGPRESLLSIARLLAAAPGVDTALPVASRVVAVLLDERDCGAARAGDIAIAVRGAKAGAPLRLDAPSRRAVLYEVTPERGATTIGVSVASVAGHRVAAVLGLTGTAAQAAERLSASRLQVSLPDSFAHASGVAAVTLETRS